MLKISLLSDVFEARLGGDVLPLREAGAALLAYLAMANGTPVLRSDIKQVFWPESSAQTQDEQSRSVLAHVRKVLHLQADVYLKREGEALRFNIHAPCDIDVMQLLDAPNSNDLTVLKNACECYRGLFYPALANRKFGKRASSSALYDGDDLDQWLNLCNARCQAAFDAVCGRLLNQLSQQQDWQSLLYYANRWRRYGSPDATLVNHLFLAHRQLQQRKQIDEVYTWARGYYGDTPELTQAYRAALRPTVPHNLPAQTCVFRGRTELLVSLPTQIAEAKQRLISLHGMGGMGKSTLALQVAHLLRDWHASRLPDGVFWVNLESAGNADDCVQHIAHALQFKFYGNASSSGQLLDYLRDKRLLLILDNFEHLLGQTDTELAYALIRQLYLQCAGLTLLITTRETLQLEMEYVVPLAGVAHTPTHADHAAYEAALYEAATHEAAQILLDHAHKPDHFFERNRDEINKLCEMTEGLPLALRLAGAQLATRAIDCATLRREIAHALDQLRLRGAAAHTNPRHLSIRAIFEASWQKLPPAAQAALAHLSVFIGHFDEASGLNVGNTDLDTLSTLTQHALLQIRAVPIETLDNSSHLNLIERYHLHALLRQFASEKLHSGDDANLADMRLCAYYLQFCQQPRNIMTLAPEWANLLHAIRTAYDLGQFANVIAFAHALGHRWNVRGRYADARAAYMLACDAAEQQQDTRALIKFLAEHGRACVRQGDYAEAERYFERGRTLSERSMDAASIALVNYERAQRAIEQGQYVQATEWLDECIEIGEELNDPALIGESYRQQARVFYASLRPEQAQPLAKLAYAFLQKQADSNKLISILRLCAEIERALAEQTNDFAALQASDEWLQKGFAECARSKDVREQAMLHYARAQLMRSLKRWADAVAEAEKGLVIFKRIGDQRSIIHVTTLLAYIELEQNRFQQAAESLENVIQLSEKIGTSQSHLIYERLSSAYLQLGEHEKAIHALQKALAIAEQTQIAVQNMLKTKLMALLQTH
ncbi:MAG: NB-ARC domain-containing protein [Anaerolineae bacterium]|nr:NB-ARC domain-containing protein [Anaerolineae bacterium]